MTGCFRTQCNLIAAEEGPSFTQDGRDVFWETVRLNVRAIETLLGLFDEQRAHKPYNELHEAYVATGGVPRVSNLRSAA